MKKIHNIAFFIVLVSILLLLSSCQFIRRLPQGTIIDHNCIDLASVPVSAIQEAKDTLHIAYGRTSHGSQLLTGMTGLVAFANGTGLGGVFNSDTDLFLWNDGGLNGALDLSSNPFSASDLGNPDRTAWEAATRNYLEEPANSDVNVIIWSWCGQASSATDEDINTYLTLMNGLEADYSDVTFVYMTGHLDGSGLNGNLHQRNEQIRHYCRTNGKWLYDFADIETYDPDGIYYGDRYPTDGCVYDANGNGTSEHSTETTPINGDANWALDWQAAHTVNTDWYNCSSAHSVALNANMKAYAAWWLWARLAGWQP